MQLVRRKILVNRSRFFLEGRDRELMTQLTLDERKSVATWLNDFWMYSFMTIKYWGRGPEIWTLSLIGSKSFPESTSSPHLNQYTNQESNPSFRFHSLPDPPTQLCRWSIHYNEPEYGRIPSPPAESIESGDAFDIEKESTWSTWRASTQARSVVTTIAQGLQENHFSSIETEDLPLATDIIVKATEKSPDELKIEALGFAIMSRNVDVIDKIINSDENYGCLPESYSGIFPFHIAARFLDGAKTCCLVMNALVNLLQGSNSINLRYVDNSGFTVLDTFFISILRSHSTTKLEDVCGKPASQYQSAGQDVDPCGRWDADSPCIRQLYASGSSKIPSDWKHMFCHTSVQAVCHSISATFSVQWRPDINTLSGLFIRRCSCCGLELKLGPLHTLTLAAFFLADNAMPGENLFGMVCCLVCLLTYRADPCIAVEVSIPELLGRGSVDRCQHSSMEPAELALEIYSERMGLWTDEANRGWRILIAILRLDREDKDLNNENLNKCDHSIHEEYERIIKLLHCGNRKQGQIWAAVQAELLTYRRLREYDGWLSQNFDMEKLRNALENDNEELLREFADGLDHTSGESKLQAYSNCGYFYDAMIPFCARREEVCNSYYANLDEWGRTTFISDWEY
ncbi:hypothetical protein Daesc_005654 [Daldinia eschscholtzii]|uniref:Uncharacterized protein n=1 Tax=Daldinia eschscholtzii TaxID=292717 RepID=A0AAX6MMD5_9PEZI